jgi:hypothetical protein
MMDFDVRRPHSAYAHLSFNLASQRLTQCSRLQGQQTCQIDTSRTLSIKRCSSAVQLVF